MELTGEPGAIDKKTRALDKELTGLVTARGSTLMELHGTGPSGAARLLADAAGAPPVRQPRPVRLLERHRPATSTQMTVIFAVSTRSYLWPEGASRSARAITPLPSRSSSRPCRSSSASHSVQNPGPDATRAAISAVFSLSRCGAAAVDAGAMTMANLAGNKAPGG